ncbi:MAG: ATP-grasp domain-containing protein [Rhizobiaceae bacterium]|nr:ATP-grasp domain-containing protein [Rhizobiaceae bacterium]
MTTILVTAIGGDVAQGVASVIREALPDWRIVGTDMNERHAGSLFCDRLLRAPAASDPEYLDWLEGAVRSEGIDLCLPLSEAELERLWRDRRDTVGGAPVVSAGFKAVEIGNDKLTTSEFLRSIALPGPWTVADVDSLKGRFPCIYKPRRGAGSKSVFQCGSLDEAEFYARHYPGGVFQEMLLPADSELTCAVFRSREGEVAVLVLARVLSGGLTSWAKVIEDEETKAQCVRIAEALNLRGAINIQLRLTAEGPRIFEINSRFSSTALIRHKLGFQDVEWTLKDMLGEEISLRRPEPGTIGVRIQSATIFR